MKHFVAEFDWFLHNENGIVVMRVSNNVVALLSEVVSMSRGWLET